MDPALAAAVLEVSQEHGTALGHAVRQAKAIDKEQNEGARTSCMCSMVMCGENGSHPRATRSTAWSERNLHSKKAQEIVGADQPLSKCTLAKSLACEHFRARNRHGIRAWVGDDTHLVP